MLNTLLKGLVDLIYGTGRAKRKYEKANPGETVFASDASKGIITSQEQGVTRGSKWIKAQRAVVMLTNTKIICGKWSIPIDEIQSSELLKFNSLIGGGAVLKIQTTEGVNYQFGMQINPEWIEQDILPLNFEKTNIKQSAFSLVIRVLAIGYLAFKAYERFFVN